MVLHMQTLKKGNSPCRFDPSQDCDRRRANLETICDGQFRACALKEIATCGASAAAVVHVLVEYRASSDAAHGRMRSLPELDGQASR